MNGEISVLVSYCNHIKAEILRVDVTERTVLIQQKDGTPTSCSFGEIPWINKAVYNKLWELQPQLEEAVYECGGMHCEELNEMATTKIEEAYKRNDISKEQAIELMQAMDLDEDCLDE